MVAKKYSQGFIKKNFRTLAFYGFTICLLLLVLAAIRLNVVKSSYQLSEGQRERSQLILDIQKMRLSMSEVLTPARVEELAKQRYNLKKPKPDQVVYFEDR